MAGWVWVGGWWVGVVVGVGGSFPSWLFTVICFTSVESLVPSLGPRSVGSQRTVLETAGYQGKFTGEKFKRNSFVTGYQGKFICDRVPTEIHL